MCKNSPFVLIINEMRAQVKQRIHKEFTSKGNQRMLMTLYVFFCGCSVKTTVNKKEGAQSVLYIANAKRNDSGPYICSLGTPTTELTHNMIYVHVINGKGQFSFKAEIN